MKIKPFIVALVAVFAAILVSAVVATGAKAAPADPSVTITATPNPVITGGSADISGTVFSTAQTATLDSIMYSGPGCVSGNELGFAFGVPITWTGNNGVYGPISTGALTAGEYSFDADYFDANDNEAYACVDVLVEDRIVVGPPAAENETWACYSHFQDAPVAITVSQFNFLTKALQPEIGMKPYWSTGFIPFANKTAANGQEIGNGYYLHCNLAGPPLTPNVWVNSDGITMGSNAQGTWVSEFGAPVTDPAGKPAAFNFYPVVAN